jgi:hypothetical protein
MTCGSRGCSDVWISKSAHSFRSALGAKHTGKLGKSPNQTDGLPNVEGQERWNNKCSEAGDISDANKETDATTEDFSTGTVLGYETAVPIQPSPDCGHGDFLNIDRWCRLAGYTTSQRHCKEPWIIDNPFPSVSGRLLR